MLIEFEVGNYRSFKEPVQLSLLAAKPIKEFQDDNTFLVLNRHRLLKSAVIYGANASGKSNLLTAMDFMKQLVFNSSKATQIEEEISTAPFKFDVLSEKEPSYFNICFIQDKYRYRYGFMVDKTAIRKEWLYRTEKVKEESLFLRDEEDIEVSDIFQEGKGIEEKTRKNALFLSVAAQFNGEISGNILRWFRNLKILILYGMRENQCGVHSLRMLQDEETRPLLAEFIRRADMGIEDLDLNETPVDEDILMGIPEEAKLPFKNRKFLKISAVHQQFHEGMAQGFTNIDFKEESEGTKKFFRIAGSIIECLKNGYMLVIDELDAKFHPLLTKTIIHLFNSAESNAKNAQLIFATHDTNLLQHGKFRRDQIWFTEKTGQAATSLYSLAEFKLPTGEKVRNDAALEKNYIQGKYGAIPFFGDFETLLKGKNSGSAS